MLAARVTPNAALLCKNFGVLLYDRIIEKRSIMLLYEKEA
jgi:hypothetical protein